MAWNPNVPTVTNRVQDDLNAMRENFQVLDAHLADTNNPHNVQAQQVPYSSGVAGFTPADVAAGLDALAGVRIVEMGSNSNGEYVRWENGLQVCWLYGTVGFTPLNIQPGGSGTFRWFYPAQFSIVPIVFGSPNQPLSDGGGRMVIIGTSSDISTVSADGYRYRTDTDQNVNGSLSLLAIGRWK